MDFIVEQTSSTMDILNSIAPAFSNSFAFIEWIVARMESQF